MKKEQNNLQDENSKLNKSLISSCCNSSDLIEPDWEIAEKMGSLWRAYACYICKKCGKACDVVNNDKV